jgi:hypothetical protein
VGVDGLPGSATRSDTAATRLRDVILDEADGQPHRGGELVA